MPHLWEALVMPELWPFIILALLMVAYKVGHRHGYRDAIEDEDRMWSAVDAAIGELH